MNSKWIIVVALHTLFNRELDALPKMTNCPTYDINALGPRPCYSRGPYASTPAPIEKDEPLVVSCAEITGYIMALHRYYKRKCTNMNKKCPDKYKYAVRWFRAVGNELAVKCDAETSGKAGKSNGKSGGKGVGEKRSPGINLAADEDTSLDTSAFPNLLNAEYDNDPYFPSPTDQRKLLSDLGSFRF